MHGDDVREYQLALKAKGYFQGAADGEYGSLTAQATFRAKYWLGYARPDKKAGRALEKFLTGEAKPDAKMNARAAKRKADAKKKPKPQTRTDKILRTALSKVGVTEQPPESNRVEFSAWYKLIGAWCAMYVTWTHVTAGFAGKAFVRSKRYAYVPYLAADARRGINGLVLAPGPSDATICCFDWQKDGKSDHVGIAAEEETLKRLAPKNFAEAKRREGALSRGDFWCVEGNTAVGNDSNGGEVMIRRRNIRQVHTFARVV